jgi:adenylosuccinate lyase
MSLDPHAVYQSPLVSRNAGPEMLALFGQRHKIGLWRRLWVELAACERELGLTRVSAEAVAAMRAKVDDIDFDRATEHEKRLRHDVMAHVHTFEEAAPAAKGVIHLGATSQYVVCNAELITYRQALRHVAGQLAAVVDALGTFAAEWKDLPCLGYTHYQPAQLTTVGKRATLWAQDFVADLEEVEHRIEAMKFRGAKGTTGTQASYLALFDGDHAKVEQLDAMLAERFGFEARFAVTGQTYPRKVDAQLASTLAEIAGSVHKFANDVRLLAGSKQLEEPFEKDQIGSSAMAYKRNPMRCERATGLARFVISLMTSPHMTAAEQWLERSLDDSSNKRLALPEMFLAIDGCLRIVTNVARGLVVYPKVVASVVAAELPFMATEDILMAAVKAGGDRQDLHEKIRQHSQAAAANVKQQGGENDLITRLQRDEAFAGIDLADVLDARRYIGRAPEQTTAFVADVVDPIRARYEAAVATEATLKV